MNSSLRQVVFNIGPGFFLERNDELHVRGQLVVALVLILVTAFGTGGAVGLYVTVEPCPAVDSTSNHILERKMQWKAWILYRVVR